MVPHLAPCRPCLSLIKPKGKPSLMRCNGAGWTETCHRLGTGTLVALIGTWQRSPPGKEQDYELQVEELNIIGPADAEVCVCSPLI